MTERSTTAPITAPATARTSDEDRVPSDGELLHLLKKGDDSGFSVLVRTRAAMVIATARRYLRSDADVADCFQETFIAVFNGVHRFEGRSTLNHWIRGIAINQCLMALRNNRRRREQSIEHLIESFDECGRRIPVQFETSDPPASVAIDQQATRGIVRQSINDLPDKYRVILLLRDIDGYTTQEAATILGININAAKTRLHRARLALKSMLQPLLVS